MSETRYSVVLQGPATTREALRAGLCKLGMDEARAEQVLSVMPCVLKAKLTLVEAERYKEAFRSAGGDVVVKVETPEALPPPPSPEASEPGPLPGPDALDASPETEPEEPPPLELLEPPPARPKTPVPIAPRAMAPSAIAIPAVGSEPKVPDAVPIKPPAPPWKHSNPWIARGVLIGLGVIASIWGLRCGSRYKATDMTHAFSAEMEAELYQGLMNKGRGTSFATRADVEEIIRNVAEKTRVKVTVIDIVEHPIEVHESAAEDGTGQKRCIAVPPDELQAMNLDMRMEWASHAMSCSAPRWVVGFSAEISATWGIAKDTQYVEHYAFAWNYSPE